VSTLSAKERKFRLRKSIARREPRLRVDTDVPATAVLQARYSPGRPLNEKLTVPILTPA
jgi:hypothetical protein